MNSKTLIITPDVVKGFARGYNLIPPLYRYEEIEDEAAEMIGKSTIPLELDGIKTISPVAISHLVNHQRDLCLDGLSELTDFQSEKLANHHQGLSLNGLKKISNSALENIVKWPRKFLGLNGLKTLSTEQTKLFSQFQGDLSLGGISALDDEDAQCLAQHTGTLSLGRLRSLTTEQVGLLIQHQGDIVLNRALQTSRQGAYLLRKCLGFDVTEYSPSQFIEDCLNEGTDEAIASARNTFTSAPKTLIFGALQKLTKDGAMALAEFPGDLELPGIENLDPTTASSLAEHRGNVLALDGLRLLTAPVAEVLGRHRGILSIQGLESFDDPKAAYFLSEHRGAALALDGLKILTAPVAEALGRHCGTLSILGLVSFDRGSSSLLALHDGALNLPLPVGGNDKFGWFKLQNRKVLWKPSGVDYHDIAVVEEILRSNHSEIEIPEEVHVLSDTVLARLGYACRKLGKMVSIPGLTQIDHEQCRLLMGSHLKSGSEYQAGSLALDGLTKLSDLGAAALGNCGFRLILSGLTELSSECLRGLTQQTRYLTLNGLEEVNEQGCRYLAAVRGPLSLDRLKSLPVGGVAALAGHIGPLKLNGLCKLPESEARTLSLHDGIIELRGIKSTELNCVLLKGLIARKFVVDEIEVFHLIRRYEEWKPPHDSGRCTEPSRTDYSAMTELLVRLLIEHLSICLNLVAKSKAEKSSAYGIGKKGVHLENLTLADVATYWRVRQPMNTINLFSYVADIYFDLAAIEEGNDCSLPVLAERETSDHSPPRQEAVEAFRNLYGIAGKMIRGDHYDFEHYSPELKPVIEACCRSARRIMCLGLTGNYKLSCETLVVLGCLFGDRVELPEVDHLSSNGARALSLFKGEVVLNGITELAPEVAQILSNHDGITDEVEINYVMFIDALELNGIRNLDPDVAAALVRHRGSTLRLNGLTTIGNEAAETLGRYEHYDHRDNRQRRRLELHGVRSLSPQAAQALSNCLDQDPWDHVDGVKVEARFTEAMSSWQQGEDDRVDGVLEAFSDLSILLAHQDRDRELGSAYAALRDSFENKLGNVSKPWVSCVVQNARARALLPESLPCTEIVLQETEPVVDSLKDASIPEWERCMRFIGLVAEAGQVAAADALLKRAVETIESRFKADSAIMKAAEELRSHFGRACQT